MKIPRYFSALALFALPLTFVSAVSTPAGAADTDVRINEVMSNDPADGFDWVELTNVGSEPVDVSGWVLKDDNDDRALAIADGTTLAPGAFLVVDVDDEATYGDLSFGLGGDDTARLFLPDGSTLIDSHAWISHVATSGRLPDGTGAFVPTTPTRGAANAAPAAPASAVTINEVESNGDPVNDWVELVNTDTSSSVDLSGWYILDDDDSHDPVVIPDGTVIESGGYFAIYTEPNFGLGSADSARLFQPDGTLAAQTTWSGHAPATWGRCPDTTGEFAETASPTRGLVNDCTTDVDPVVTAPWRWAGDPILDVVAPGTFGEDISGLDFAPDGTLYAANNDNGQISELTGNVRDGFTVAQTWATTYPGGSGTLDAEGLSVIGDGRLLVATERDNDDSGVSRPSVLLVDPASAPAAEREWNLSDIVGPVAANGGLEAVEWISDAEAVAAGFAFADGTPYDPSAIGPHLGGIAVVGVEGTGDLHVVALLENGGRVDLQTNVASGFQGAMALDWDGTALQVLCDEVCDGNSAVFAPDGDGQLVSDGTVYARPTAMPNHANEGYARLIGGVDGFAEQIVWADDAALDGIALRGAFIAADDSDPAGGDSDDAGAGSGTDQPSAQGSGDSLANAGSPVAPWTVLLGLLAVAAGAALVRRSGAQ